MRTCRCAKSSFRSASPTGRDPRGFLHRGRQLRDALYACGPLGVNFRGLRLPLIGWKVGVHGPAVAAIAALGPRTTSGAGPERGFRAHLVSGRTTGILKLVGIPAVGLVATRKLSGALLVGLAANALNQLDTRPGRALKAYLAAASRSTHRLESPSSCSPTIFARWRCSGTRGRTRSVPLLGLNSVKRFTGRGHWVAIGALAGLTIIGERTSIGAWIERTPGLAGSTGWTIVSSSRPTKYVFVTGGVVSALGKGIVAASLGRLLKARGLRVQAQKFDPYLNVDPGTMSPFQHGEVFVTEDGAETDLDIGHYERFIDENLTRAASHTAGAIWDAVLRKERKGEFLGATVQVIPHITNEIKSRIRASAVSTPTDVVISEIGGTVGDIESLPFLEAIRQFRREVGAENVLYLHVTLVPFLEAAGELKTKPTQHSVNELRRIGIHPDIVVCRSHEELSADIRDKIALFADVEPEAVIAKPDVPAMSISVPLTAESPKVSTGSSARSSACRRRKWTSANWLDPNGSGSQLK